MNFTAGRGGALAYVNGDGSVTVINVPPNCTVSLVGQRGFGDASTTDSAATLATATDEVRQQLGFYGAV